MRLVCRFAIVLYLSLPAAGMTAGQQDPAGSANFARHAQPPTPSKENAPAEQVPAETTPAAANPQTPAAGEKTPDSVPAKKADAGSTSETSTRVAPKRRKRAAPASAPAPDGAPRKIVVREGGASEPAAQIAPDITPAEAARQRQNAVQLLDSTDGQLKQFVGRTLDARQRETVGQIRNYMDGAHSALKEGDVRRASTLAQKAHLLADDLAKR